MTFDVTAGFVLSDNGLKCIAIKAITEIKIIQTKFDFSDKPKHEWELVLKTADPDSNLRFEYNSEQDARNALSELLGRIG